MPLRSSEKGQTLVEYAFILVLVAIVVIGALYLLGPAIANVFNEIVLRFM
jgi:pilus assembly protein Flp/PilA